MRGCPGRPWVAAILFFMLVAPALAQTQARVEYEIAFPNAAHHEAEITATFVGAPAGRPLEVRMSRSSPGRYALHEFAKNVYNVRAADEKGAPLAVEWVSPHQWNVTGFARGAAVRVSYTLFGDEASGTWTGIDATMAHLSMPATFLWARGLEAAPIRIRFRRPAPEWKIATQLAATADPEVFTAPHLQYFLDSPTMLGALRFREWPVQSNGKSYTIRIAINDPGASDQDVDGYAENAKRIVAEQIAVFGEAPDFDYGSYTFLANFAPQVDGDGMEHRNSTSMTSARSIKGAPRANLGVLSHEFFHAWNVERLRPRSIEPFNFEDANVSGELWLAEGFTQYYGNLLMKRAGFSGDDASYGRGLGFTINAVLNSAGRRLHGPMEMSRRAVFEDGGGGGAPTNSRNLFVSYYIYGNVVALGLDLSLRARFGRTLDDYMRELWQSYGKHQKEQTPSRPYTVADLRASLAKLTGDAAFADEFFARYVTGRDVVDFEPLLARAGFVYRRARPGKVWLDAQLREQGGGLIVAGSTLATGPLYQAGVDRGDRILNVDGQAVYKTADLQPIFERHKPGDVIRLDIEQRGVKRTVQLTFTEDPAVEIVPFESLNRELTPEIQQFRAAWLGTKVK